MRRTSLHNREPVLIHWLAHSMCIQSHSQNPNTPHNATSNQMPHSVLFTPTWAFILLLFREREHIARFAPWEERCSLESYYTSVGRRGVSDSTFNIKLLYLCKVSDRPRLDERNLPPLSNTWSGHITPLGEGQNIVYPLCTRTHRLSDQFSPKYIIRTKCENLKFYYHRLCLILLVSRIQFRYTASVHFFTYRVQRELHTGISGVPTL